jgi:hypothetical protein
MAANSDTREAELDRLYGLPLAQFTAARDDVVRRLRREGDREAAAELKQIRKPSVAAWALNQVQRDDPRGVERLIMAGEGLREAQASLLAGGDRELLREAIAQERELVQELAGHAKRHLVGAGQSASAAVQAKLWSTLHAVAADSEARELLRTGRLTRDYEISDLGLGVAPSGPRRAPKVKPAERSQSDADADADAAVARQLHEVDRQLERSRARQLQALREAETAQRRVEDARHEAALAAASLEAALADDARARASAQETTARVAELEATLLELQSRPLGQRLVAHVITAAVPAHAVGGHDPPTARREVSDRTDPGPPDVPLGHGSRSPGAL